MRSRSFQQATLESVHHSVCLGYCILALTVDFLSAEEMHRTQDQHIHGEAPSHPSSFRVVGVASAGANVLGNSRDGGQHLLRTRIFSSCCCRLVSEGVTELDSYRARASARAQSCDVA